MDGLEREKEEPIGLVIDWSEGLGRRKSRMTKISFFRGQQGDDGIAVC